MPSWWPSSASLTRPIGTRWPSTCRSTSNFAKGFFMTGQDVATAKHYRWNDLTAEPLKGGITRRLITSERMMIAHVYLTKGDEVPRHAHENEQITYILEGALHFWLGED